MNNTAEVIGELNALIRVFKKNKLTPGLEHYEHTLTQAVGLLSLENNGYKLATDRTRDQDFKIQIKTGTKLVLIDYRTIDYAQGLKDYTILHTTAKKYFVKGSVKTAQGYLPKDYFMRVHKSFIVPVRNINSFFKNRIELDSITIPVGRRFRNNIDAFFKLKGADQALVNDDN